MTQAADGGGVDPGARVGCGAGNVVGAGVFGSSVGAGSNAAGAGAGVGTTRAGVGSRYARPPVTQQTRRFSEPRTEIATEMLLVIGQKSLLDEELPVAHLPAHSSPASLDLRSLVPASRSDARKQHRHPWPHPTGDTTLVYP